MLKRYLPKVTVVTIVYNDVRHIEKTILSVINQTYSELEYIVIDGGSTDGTVDIIKKYKDKISYWVSERDKGIYDAMNKGIDAATGEWILFRNCGDYFSSLSDIAKVFSGISYDGVDIIYGKCLRWDNYGYYIKEPELQSSNVNNGKMPVCHPSTFIRTDIHKSMHFDLRYKIAADHDFFYKCIQQGKVYKYVPYVLAIFDASEGASAQNQHRSAIEHFYIYGGTDSDKISKIKLFIKVYKLKIVLFIRKLTPGFIMHKRRLAQGRKVWTNTFTVEDLITQAISNEDTNF